ncbi:MAG: sulfite exporter TauE/SafE family protein [Roseivivax sp.]|nr:sulfite exporter TauE/SafE family protein [Roseivivax sp.]
MPDILAQALGQPGLGWIVAVTLAAGIVYGFAGFGAALIFMPVASRLMPVELAVASFNLAAMASLVTVVPQAWRQVNRRSVVLMIAVATLTIPLGVRLLKSGDPETLRWAVLGVTAVTLLALVSGWRYQAAPTPVARAAVAAGTGLVGGATGLMGPVLILFQLAGRDSAATSRATTLVFLTVTSLLLLPHMALQGLITGQSVALGLLLLVPYGLGTRIGRSLFQPADERLYRYAAYVLIACAVVAGLPVWD